MVQKASTRLSFKQIWTFPEQVEKRIAGKMDKGLWLHAPVGISKIGLGPFNDDIQVVTVDVDPRVKPDVVADIFHLPFKNNTFDGAISDPIWYTKEKEKTIGLSYPQRRYLSYEIRDKLKPGALWIFNGLWNPIVKGLKIMSIETALQAFSSFRNISLLVYLKKVNNTLE